jgi:sec-independent protein translocase protein TatA
MTLTQSESFKKNNPLHRVTEDTPMMPGPWELILILLIVVMIFGAKRIPEIMGGIGKGIKTFKRSMEIDETPTPPPPSEPKDMSNEKIEPK